MISGQWETGNFNGHDTKEATITFDTPMINTDYAVSVNLLAIVGGAGWDAFRWRLRDKTVNGFKITVFNADTAGRNSATFEWSVIY